MVRSEQDTSIKCYGLGTAFKIFTNVPLLRFLGESPVNNLQPNRAGVLEGIVRVFLMLLLLLLLWLLF